MDDILIDRETAAAFDVLLEKGFTPEQFERAYKYYIRELARDVKEPHP